MRGKIGIMGAVAVGLVFYASGADKKNADTPEKIAKGDAVMWTDPTDIATRNLYYGRGGEEHKPAEGHFVFEKEDTDGTNPKFTVHDSAGTKWKIKLGDESKPETVASRLVWATGYFIDEDYLLPSIMVDGIAGNMHRGQDLVGNGGALLFVRLKRSGGDKKVGEWKWKENPFSNTRELNGLRVLMAIMNNWDLKDVNNAIWEVHDKDAAGGEKKRMMYGVSDLGATFGSERLDMARKSDKGDYDTFAKTGFIDKTTATTVDFRVPGSPSAIMIANPKSYFGRKEMQWIGRDIPRADAKWMGDLLGKLSKAQIKDAFRAGGYSYGEIENYTNLMMQRIADLQAL